MDFNTLPSPAVAPRDGTKAPVVDKKRATQDWLAADPARRTFLNNTRFDFAISMADALCRWGSFTPGQMAAIDKCVARDRERAAARAAPPAPDALDLSALPSGYYAVPEGDTRLKLRVRHVTEKTNPGSSWVGWAFVDDGGVYGAQQKYGRQSPGGRYEGKCVEQLRAVLADPRAASKAYGQLVGRCGVCGRLLEDADSVAAGIGPICAGRMGW